MPEEGSREDAVLQVFLEALPGVAAADVSAAGVAVEKEDHSSNHTGTGAVADFDVVGQNFAVAFAFVAAVVATAFVVAAAAAAASSFAAG